MKCYIKIILKENDNSFFGPGVASLLKGIKETGSVKESAASMSLSYSKAWKIIKNAEIYTKKELVKRLKGGASGGSASLTVDGEILLEKYEILGKKIKEYSESTFEEIFYE